MSDFDDLDRFENERRRRLQATIELDRPSFAEVQRIRQRFERGRRQSARSAPVSRAVLLGFAALLLSAGAVAAAAGQRWLSRSFGPAGAPAPAPSSSLARPARRSSSRPSSALPSPTARVSSAPPAAGPSAAAEPIAPVAQVAPIAQVAPLDGALRPLQAPARPSENPRGASEIELPPTTTGGGAWARAAAALRRGDQAAVDSALAELGRSPEAATRDAAALTRAQLEIAQGRRERALPVLAALARTGATAFVRRRAQAILDAQK